MNITITEIGILAGVALGLFNLFAFLWRGKSIGMLERGQYLESVNKSIALANDRALKAEERAIAAEERANKLEERMLSLEENLSYRLTFDVKLGTSPALEHVEIKHYPERRKTSMPISSERRLEKE